VVNDQRTDSDLPTKEECFEAFWDILAAWLVDRHANGQLGTPAGPQ
jgi:hypothetical protein